MRYRIECCKDCVPPKRHVGCHSSCKEYIDEKAEYEIDKRKEKDSINPLIYRSQFVGNAIHRKKNSKKPQR